MTLEEISEHEYVEILQQRLEALERKHANIYKLLMRGTEVIDGYRTRYYIERSDDEASVRVSYQREEKVFGFKKMIDTVGEV